MYTLASVKERLLRNIVINEFDCWEWQRASDKDGYGCIWADGKVKRAHRVSYEIYRTTFPSELTIDHLCRNKICINPDHLEPVSRSENLKRSWADNSRPKTIRRIQTHCRKGHAFFEENTYTWGNQRRCVKCVSTRQKNNRQSNST